MQSLLTQSLFFRQNWNRELCSHRPDAPQLLLRHSLPSLQEAPARSFLSQTAPVQNNWFRWEAQLS